VKKYIPALITSVIALPVGCVIIRDSLNLLNYSAKALLLYSVAGITLVLLNIKFAHWIMKKIYFMAANAKRGLLTYFSSTLI